jgi:predicted Fe-Mo cluster-binding NifX family protein
MKIAIVTDDHQTISAHFGRAAYYEIFTVENGEVIGRNSVQKSNHQHVHVAEPHQENQSHNHDHNAMMESIMDCSVLITRGLGTGAYNALKIRSIEPIITDVKEIERAVNEYLAGTLINHPELLH